MDMGCIFILRAVPAWGLYEWIGKQIMSSPLIFAVSCHEAADG